MLLVPGSLQLHLVLSLSALFAVDIIHVILLCNYF